MRTSALLALALGTVSVLGGPISARSTYAVKGSHPVPSGWRQVQRAPADHMLELRIGITQGDFAGLDRYLMKCMSPRRSRCVYSSNI